MNNELKHYGKKGQHWGIRNGPPYPLSRQYTKAELRSLYSSKSGKRARKGSTLDESGSGGSGEASDKKTTRAEIKRIKAEIKLERAKAKTVEIEAKREQENRRIQEEAARKADVVQQKKDQDDRDRVAKNVKILIKNPKAAENLTDEELEEVYRRLDKEKRILDAMSQQKTNRDKLKKPGVVKPFVKDFISDVSKNAIIPLGTGLISYALYKKINKKVGANVNKSNPGADPKDIAKEIDKLMGMMFARVNKQKSK